MGEMWELDSGGDRRVWNQNGRRLLMDPSTSDLHAWSIYRQNLNSDFTDSALGAEGRSPLPYGNFHLREETVHSILRNPRLGPRSELGTNATSYLKFGLPRVNPPPSGGGRSRDGLSSGYESPLPPQSTNQQRSPPKSRNIGGGGGLRGAKSETDLSQGVILNRFRRPNTKKDGSGGLLRPAQSEGNLLNDLPDLNQNEGWGWLGNARSNGAGQNEGRSSALGNSRSQYLPHLQVRNLTVGGRRGGKLVDGVSFDLRAGDMLALMATKSSEGTGILEALAGRCPFSGELILNGNRVNSTRLGRRVGYLRKDYRLHPQLTPEEMIRFTAAFRRTNPHPPSDAKIRSLLEDLGLVGVSRSQIANLTPSEKQRLALGCQLIQDTQILLLDSTTGPMDIFDTFFLISLLEEWTKRTPGILIITIHPPTFEIFSTFSKILLISAGRPLFSGYRTEILPYFAFIDYPCPPYKNPSDYYIDLVTMDDLSSEALLESSQRIQGLAESWATRQESLPEPGPPHPLPSPIRNPSGAIFGEIFLIWRFLGLNGWKSRCLRFFFLLLVATSISIILGGIYWDVRFSSPAHVNSAYDRIGQSWSLIILLSPPIFFLLLLSDQSEFDFVTRDVEEGLYSKAAYFMAQVIGEIPFWLTIFLGYILPDVAMGGVRDVDDMLTIIGLILLCIYICMTWVRGVCLLGGIRVGLTFGGTMFLLLSLTSGYVIHPKDLGEWIGWTRVLSPVSWLLPLILREEFRGTSFELCSNPIVGLRGNLLMRELSCGLSRGESVMAHFDVPTYPPFLPLLVAIGMILLGQLVGLLSWLSRRQKPVFPPPLKP